MTLANATNQLSANLTKRKIICYSMFILGTFLVSTVFAGPILAAYAQSSSSQVQPIFSTPINLSGGSSQATNPDVWNVGNHVYVAWSEGSNGLMFRESPDGGTTWYPQVSQAAENLSTTGRTTAPLLSANGSNVYVVWSQTVGTGVAQIYEATSTTYGASFSAPVQVSTETAASITPVIASWGNNVYVAWTSGTDSYLSCSSNLGASWTHPYEYGNQHEPEIAAWGSYVYVVSDAGMVINSNVNVNSCSNASSWKAQNIHPWGSEPCIWTYSQNVYASWESKSNTSVVYYSYSNTYGSSWTPVRVLATTMNDTWAPMVWAYGNSAWIAYHSNPGGSLSRVYVYTTNNAGKNWTGPVGLSTTPKSGSDTSFPFTVVSSDGQNVFVAWSQQIKTGYWQLYVSYSGNGGTTWFQPPGIDASQNPAGTEGSNNNDLADAAIASYGTSCFAVWQLISGSTNQVYFSASTMGTPTVPASMSAKPVKGPVGTDETVTGSFFMPSTTITIEFDGTPVTSTASNSGGNFTATFPIPNTTAGSHVITATDGTNTLNSPFAVTPKISEIPVAGPGGRSVNLTGSGFAADSSVTINFNGSSVQSAMTSSQGSFSVSYTVPSLSNGKYTVESTDGSGNSATATFTIN